MQQSSGSLGHSKHKKAFGSKKHKSAFSRILLQKDENKRNEEKAISKKKKGFSPVLFNIGM